MIGQTISHFRILEKPPTTSGQVGGSGMGAVYKAQDVELRHNVR
jgi:hypothetical protein